MTQYVNSVTLDVNGKDVSNFKSITIGETEIFRQVKAMNKTGHAKVTARHSLSVEYLVPVEDPEVKWSEVADARVSVVYENGKRKTFTGVYVLKVGEEKIDSENDVTKTIELSAEGMVVE
jgi:hypothetical protein